MENESKMSLPCMREKCIGEDLGYDLNAYKLQDAMADIATVFAGAVAGLKYIKPKE